MDDKKRGGWNDASIMPSTYYVSLWGTYFDVGCFRWSGPASPEYTEWPDFSIFILWQERIISRTQYKNSSCSNCERVVRQTSFSHMHWPQQSPDLIPIEIFWDVLCKTSCSPIINAKLWMETNAVTLPKFIRDSNVTGDLRKFWRMWLFLFCRAEYDNRHYTFLILLFSIASFRGHHSESFASISPTLQHPPM